jgi:hypothetical protein
VVGRRHHLLIPGTNVLFEQLGEEDLDTLGSIIAAEGAITSVVGMTQMNPLCQGFIAAHGPILRNRHEKVQEASINLIGRIGEYFQLDTCNTCLTDIYFLLADRGAELIPAREWMRICFEPFDLLKAHRPRSHTSPNCQHDSRTSCIGGSKFGLRRLYAALQSVFLHAFSFLFMLISYFVRHLCFRLCFCLLNFCSMQPVTD